MYGAYINFNAATSEVTVSDASGVMDVGSSGTATFHWRSRITNIAAAYYYFSRTLSSSQRHFAVAPYRYSYGEMHIELFTGSSYETLSPSIGSTDVHNWHDYTLTINGTEVKLYIDGSLFDTKYLSSSFTNFGSSGHFMFGNRYGNTSSLYADMSYALFWDKVCSSSEISDMIEGKIVGNETGLVAFFMFAEGSGTTTDIVNSLEGTLVSPAAWVTKNNIYMKVSGAWKELNDYSAPYFRDNGEWYIPQKIYANVSGTEKIFWNAWENQLPETLIFVKDRICEEAGLNPSLYYDYYELINSNSAVQTIVDNPQALASLLHTICAYSFWGNANRDEFWLAGTNPPPQTLTGNYGDNYSRINNGYLEMYGVHQNWGTWDWYITIDLTEIDELEINTSLSNSASQNFYYVRVVIDSTVIFSTNALHGTTKRILDVSSYTGEHTLRCRLYATGGSSVNKSWSAKWGTIRLVG